jgi:hypothetical protein
LLINVFPGECPIFCLGDLVTLRHIDTATVGKVLDCEGATYEVEFPFGVRNLKGNLIRLVDDELSAHRFAVFRSALHVVDGVLKMRSPYMLTGAMRIET